MNHLFRNIRNSLLVNEKFKLPLEVSIDFNPQISQIYITLFQENINSLRWGSKKETLEKTIQRIIFKLKSNPKFQYFNVSSSDDCKLMFEIVTKEYPCNIRNLTTMRMNSPNRFESGVNGFKYKCENVTRFFMPSDGYTKSIMSVNQLLNYMSKQCGIAKKTNKISERVHLMRREDIEYIFIESRAYVTYKDEVLELERGYPKSELDFSKDIMYDKTIKSLDWLVKNMNDDGSFLYYYDPYLNTIVDDIHPKMIDPLYNNILRHSGGTVSLIRGYEISGSKLYLEKAKESIEFLLSTFKTHTYKKEFACYPFFNQKSKLGGAGIGLIAMMHYYLQTGDECYRKQLDGLVRHILSRVDKAGEMLGYYIHPKFNDAKALLNPSDEVKKELFSFYYPGEALLGLALYYHHIQNIDKVLKEDIRLKSEMALDFLVNVRPIKYDYMFEPLPADAWLMQAIEEWVKVDGLKKQSYIDFVFDDTKAMFEHMYTDKNTKLNNKDYIGGFYYDYGEHVYHDASRCEGVVSAYYLAKYLKDDAKASWIMKNMLLSAKGLMKTFHNEKSVYAHKEPKRAVNSFRFKLTRQWIRVDSVQHASCFFARLHQVI
ncbi:MAG: protein containing Six-hairpin glycosidase-like domain protein [Sulfurimonas sp.]|nr:protein containing Six-hairpin glycosidase-like domain protein [Sulfurimonas sp.]MDQ7059907.1 protein containing Six-hairpin glycosidase-like domain protein [Sulfurimonas sp.]